MIWSWLHVVIVHLPVFASVASTFLLWKALRSQYHLRIQNALLWVMITALSASLAYFTGAPSADYLQTVMEINQAHIEDHAIFGRIAFVVMAFSGAGALAAQLNFLQEEEPPKALLWAVLICCLLASLILLWTAHLGGSLRRPDFIF